MLVASCSGGGDSSPSDDNDGDAVSDTDGDGDQGTDTDGDGGDAVLPEPGPSRSLHFVANPTKEFDYARQSSVPATFGIAEFTLDFWLKLDDGYPVGPTVSGDDQLTNWTSSDNGPYVSADWWWRGNFLLDGHNHAALEQGTFSVQIYGGGRLRWLFGDGSLVGPGNFFGIEEWPASGTPSLLDGLWHQASLVRRYTGMTSATLELWIDGALVASETTNVRTNMQTAYWQSWTGYPTGQQGWVWGAHKQAAIGVIDQYEDFKGRLAEVRFWSRARSTTELANDWKKKTVGNEVGLVGWYRFDEDTGSLACDEQNGTSCWSISRGAPNVWASDGPPLE